VIATTNPSNDKENAVSDNNEPRPELVEAVLNLHERWGPERLLAELVATGWEVTPDEVWMASVRASGIRNRNRHQGR
jgi:hypothetical protein